MRFRLLVGMSFWAYTLMNASYVLIGSMLAPSVHWDRAFAVFLVYILAVGICAHALDAMGPNKPWGRFMSRRQLGGLAAVSLAPALAIGAYYAVTYAIVLLVVGATELFFLFAYNLEFFGSRFHTEPWFAFSWGFLPVQAGYAVQTGFLDLVSLAGGLIGFVTAYAELRTSRRYKRLKAAQGASTTGKALRYERALKGIVSSVLLLALLLAGFRLARP